MLSNPQKIIIIGASSGIGKKLAEQYALAGNLVGITGRRMSLLEEIKNKFPNNIEVLCHDVTRNENNSELDTFVKQLGGLDLLIISAGGGDVSKELDWNIDKRTIDTNVNGFAAIANWAFNYFVQQGHGHLAAISSIAANRGNSHAPAYSASKAFQSIYLEGLHMKAHAMKKPIYITCIEPGFVDTAMAKSDKLFWLVPVDKASRQIIKGIGRKKKLIYISRRWFIIAKLLKWMPDWLFYRIVK